MTIDHVLAVVTASDFDASHDWYQRLFDTPATNVPMPGNLAEWRVTDTGWLQVFHDPDRAGTSMVNLAVADLNRRHADLRARGIDTGEIAEAKQGVRLCSVNDPTTTPSPSSGASVSSTDPAPIIVAGHLTVDIDDREGYLRSCEAVVQTARGTDGCLDFAISADLVDPTRINVYEGWRDRSALEAFRDQGPGEDQMSTLIAINVGEYQAQPSGSDT